jgi:tetratricopeptide (TPR) repeat protein
MSIIEVHPEELLDREQRGELTPRDQAQLSAHLARCAACRLERQLRADFAADLRMPSGSSDLTDVIAGALRACELPEAAVPPRAVAAGGRRTGPTARRVAMLLVACAVLSVGVGYAGAQLGLAQRSVGALLEQIGVRGPTAQRARRARVAQVPGQAPAQAPTQRSAVLASASHEAAPMAGPIEQRAAALQPARSDSTAAARTPPAPVHQPARIKAPERGRARKSATPQQRDARSTAIALASISRANRVSVTSGTISEPAPAPQALPSSPAGAGPEPVQSIPPESASRLFERANRARHRGLSGEARVLYAELRSQYPDSAEARLSQALVARLQLDQGELDAALSGFDAYLNGPDRALHEEAMVGRIRVLSRLGRSREAAAAARLLLEAHPRSAFAEEAEAIVERVERD